MWNRQWWVYISKYQRFLTGYFQRIKWRFKVTRKLRTTCYPNRLSLSLHTCTHARIYIRLHMNKYLHIHVQFYIHMYTHLHTKTCMHIFMYTCAHIYEILHLHLCSKTAFLRPRGFNALFRAPSPRLYAELPLVAEEMNSNHHLATTNYRLQGRLRFPPSFVYYICSFFIEMFYFIFKIF